MKRKKIINIDNKEHIFSDVNDMVGKIIEPPNRPSYNKWMKYIKEQLEKYKLKRTQKIVDMQNLYQEKNQEQITRIEEGLDHKGGFEVDASNLLPKEYEQDKSYTDEMDNDINHPINQELYEDVLDFTLNRVVKDLTEFGRLSDLIYQYQEYQYDKDFILPTMIEDEVGKEIIKRLQPKEES